MIDGKNFFDQPINSDCKTYDNIRKIATGYEIIHNRVFIRLYLL